MSSQPPPQGGPEGGADRPSFAEENAMRIASESLQHYDEASDTYHVSYGPPVPAVTVHDPERGVLVRVEPRSQQVEGSSISNSPFSVACSAYHALKDGIEKPTTCWERGSTRTSTPRSGSWTVTAGTGGP